VGVNASQANFQITFPLLRGRGQEVVTAKERGAGMDYDAALLDMNQTVANLVLAIAQDYWGLVAAKKRLRVAVDSEARGRSLVEVTQALIDANQLPRIEMDNAAANLADRVSQRVAADASLVAAREQLALSAGIPGPDVARGLDTTDEFPVGAEVEAPPEGSHAVGEWLDNARRYRADMLAAAKRVEAANTRRIAASDQLRPSLGLVGVVGYNGLRQGRTIWQYLGSPFPAAAGLNASVGLQYTFAPANDVAKGQLEMANSAISSAKAQLDDLERSVRSSIIVSVENLRSSVLRLRTTGETVDSYRMALDGEREKLKLGVSSLTDVVLAEDRLNTALLAQVDAQVTYSQGIAQMRFAIGALVPATGPIQSVNVNLLRTVPGSMQAGDN
jgi:outer membrane protein TolC